MPRQAATTGNLRNDPDDLLACFRCRTLAGRRQVGTASAGERRFREVRRRTRPMGTFQDRTSMDRIIHAVFIHEDRSRGLRTPISRSAAKLSKMSPTYGCQIFG